MKIGTPLTRSATKILFLGAGELGKEVIIALQRYGAEVIAVDRYENAPGMQVAHRSHVINMANPEELRSLILTEKPNLIVPEIEAIATAELLKIEHEGIAEIIPTARAVNLTMNREGIRRLAAEELGLPTSAYRFASTLEELQAAATEISYPVIVKPVMSSSGKGQSFVKNPEQIESAWEYALKAGRVNHTRVIVEEVIEFDFEITLLTVRAREASGNIATSFCEPVGHIQMQGDYVESWQPQKMSANAFAEAKRIAETVTANLGGRGIFGVELFVKGDKVYFSEVSPRPHDTGMVTMITQNQSEFELHARAILGLPVSPVLTTPGASAVIYGKLEAKGIAYEGLDQALSLPNTEVRLFGKPESFERRRMGVALAAAGTIDSARITAKEAAARVKPVEG